MNKNIINYSVFLEIKTYVGISFDAKHYYGDLIFNSKKFPISRTLNIVEANKLNKKDKPDSFFSYKEGSETNRFPSKVKLINYAKKIWKSQFPNALLLIEGESYTYQAQKILEGPVWYKKKCNIIFNKLEAMYKKYGSYGNDTIMNFCDCEWRKLNQHLLEKYK